MSIVHIILCHSFQDYICHGGFKNVYHMFKTFAREVLSFHLQKVILSIFSWKDNFPKTIFSGKDQS